MKEPLQAPISCTFWFLDYEIKPYFFFLKLIPFLQTWESS